jgi:UDP-galactopyranose mutase
VHRYGPHIFHTNSKRVVEYLSSFTQWRGYEHVVLARMNGSLYPIPINRTTVNKLYGLGLATEEEARLYFQGVKEPRTEILNSEDVVVSQIGRDLFEKFFRHYSFKQWGKEPKELSPSVCARIPFRLNDDCRYFSDHYQCMPSDGYTALFRRMLDHPLIDVMLSSEFRAVRDSLRYERLIYTGPIDEYFDYAFGRLPYRSIRFEFEHHDHDSVQDAAQINHVDPSVDFTRVVEYKKLTGQQAPGSTLSREYAQPEGEPYYPIPTPSTKLLYERYHHEAAKDQGVVFAGRLAEYQYYNMDQVIANSLKIAEAIIRGTR